MRWAGTVVMLASLAACQGDAAPVTAAIDPGTPDVAVLGEVVVAAEAGATVTVTHAGGRGDEAPVTHALVGGATDALPPVFTRGAGGIVPNPAVWGPCRGGDVADADGACPQTPDTAATAWDGSAYWSTGAMLPGESREIPLAADMAAGEHRLMCALHPDLRLVVRVGEDAARQDAGSSAPDVVEVARTAAQEPPDEARVVRAGVALEDPAAYVQRFVPEEMRVVAGQSVTFRAGGRAPVDVVFGAEELSLTHTSPEMGLPVGRADGWNGRGELRSGFLSADPSAGAAASEFTVRFLRPGTYRYATRFADGMVGTVVVEEAADG